MRNGVDITAAREETVEILDALGIALKKEACGYDPVTKRAAKLLKIRRLLTLSPCEISDLIEYAVKNGGRHIRRFCPRNMPWRGPWRGK